MASSPMEGSCDVSQVRVCSSPGCGGWRRQWSGGCRAHGELLTAPGLALGSVPEATGRTYSQQSAFAFMITFDAHNAARWVLLV